MADSLSTRLLGGLTINVVRVSGLPNVAKFGKNSPQVVIAVNLHKKYTRTVEDGGSSAEFHESLFFNVDCQPSDMVHIKVKHDSKFVDTTIGIFSLSLGEFIKHQRRTMKLTLVDEDDFDKQRGTIELVQEYHGTNEPPMPVRSPTTAAQRQSISSVGVTPTPAAGEDDATAPAAAVLPPVVEAAFVPTEAVRSAPVAPESPAHSHPPPPLQVQPLSPVSPAAVAATVEASAPPLPVQPFTSAAAPQPYSPHAIQPATVVSPVQPTSPSYQQAQQQPPHASSPAHSQPQQQHGQQSSPHAFSPQSQVAAPAVSMPSPAYASPAAPQMSVAPPVVGPPVFGSGVAATGYPGQPQPQATFAPPVVQHQATYAPPVVQQQHHQQPQQPHGYRSPVNQQQPQPPSLYMSAQPYGSNPQQQQPPPQMQPTVTYNPAPSVPYGSIAPPYSPPHHQQQQPQQVHFQPQPAAPYMSHQPQIQQQQYQSPPPPHQQHSPQAFGSGAYGSQQPYGSAPAPMPAAPVATAVVGVAQPSSQRFSDLEYLGARASVARVIAVHVWASPGALHGIQLVYDVHGQRVDGPVVGAMLGPMRALPLPQGDNLVGLGGRMGPVVLDALSVTTLRTGTHRFGAPAHSPSHAHAPAREWTLPVAQGSRIMGLHGSFMQQGITSIGAFITYQP